MKGAAVAGRDGREVGHADAGAVPGEEEAGAVLVEKIGALEETDTKAAEELFGSGRGALLAWGPVARWLVDRSTRPLALPRTAKLGLAAGFQAFRDTV